ncbi:MAG: phosphoribosylamine--glycine ligase [archaeon]
MVNILLVGNDARTHCVAEAIVSSPQKPVLFSYMKARNPGIAKLSKDVMIGAYDDLDGIKRYAKSIGADLAVIGPEDPLNKGVVDVLEDLAIPAVGPKKTLARLETSKSFTRKLLEKYSIPGNPRFKVFETMDGIAEFLEELGEFVIKPDGLTGGKGVKVFGDHIQSVAEGVSYCKEVLMEHPLVVVEEKLDGEEFSLQSFCDGKNLLHTPPVQDHKRAFADDLGPNTGGMGSYSTGKLLPFMTPEDLEEAENITQMVCNALAEETGQAYKGVMYGGFICTASGVKLIEYNARLGDPEAMNVLPVYKGDFVELCKAITEGTLNGLQAEFSEECTVCKYAVPQGYPANPAKGARIDPGIAGEAKVYFASVEQKGDGLHMTSSRALAFVGVADTIDEAEQIAEKAVCSVDGPVSHREDIGTQRLLNRRIEHMKSLRK